MADGRDGMAQVEMETMAVLIADDEWVCETLPDDGTQEMCPCTQHIWFYV